jgi:hypothetical protein
MPFCRNQKRIWFGQAHVWADDDKEEKSVLLIMICHNAQPAEFRQPLGKTKYEVFSDLVHNFKTFWKL